MTDLVVVNESGSVVGLWVVRWPVGLTRIPTDRIKTALHGTPRTDLNELGRDALPLVLASVCLYCLVSTRELFWRLDATATPIHWKF